MKKIYFLLLILPLFCFSQKSYWTKIETSKINKSQLLDRTTTASKFDTYNLQLEQLKTQLSQAVSRSSNEVSNTFIKFPNIDGKLERYQIYEASIMEPDFAAKYPEIQSYVGINIDNSGVTMRFSTTIFGFHAAIYTIGKTYYIDPYTEDLNSYILYAKENLYSDIDRIGCQLTDEIALENPYQPNPSSISNQRNANDGLLRTFRLSLSSTQEYSNFHINAAGQQTASDLVKRQTVLAAMNVTMTRVNGLFERDLSLTMQLVEIINPPFSGTSTISLVEPDGFTDNDATALLSQNQSITDTRIGPPNYDAGHVFTTGGGGIASLGGICLDETVTPGINNKARAVTGLPSPVGDPYDIDFVAHEMGHHFGANHIFNGSQGDCSGANRNAATSVEPGSGTSIMGYAGICSGDNIQLNSDDHFNAISIDEMYARITGTAQYASFPTCSTNTSNGNTAPIVDAGLDFTIPFGTAFTLSGTGSDPDGSAVLSYNWEQVDPGSVAGQPSPTDTDGPMFRSRPSLPIGDRTFPQLSDVLAGNLTPQWEVIPNVARTMNFALTVRDNQSPNGGQTNRDDMIVTVANTGPFEVTSQSTTGIVYPENSSTTIEWVVAGTNANGINTSQVNILLSTDGGQNFNTTLAANTINDGSETITFPAGVTSANSRIKVEAVGNIYFAINPELFAIGNYTFGTQEVCDDYVFNTGGTTVVEDGGSYTGYNLNIPDSRTISDLNIAVNITSPNNGDIWYAVRAPWQPADIQQLASGVCPGTSNSNFVFDDEGSPIDCNSTNNGDNVLPQVALSFADGEQSNGNWVFFLTDVVVDGTTSTWNSTTITICYEVNEFTLADNDFELNDFALFPNPNKGEFTLQFNSNSGKDVNVNIYDISGKLVFENKYDSVSRFNKQIELNNVSTGVYIMKVTDGEKTITRKLIVE
ncbi:MAG: T9SS type A sorting domain-containing protein [Winogradskyella sp.]|uniref:reprolysin-like metallopeptidase n=1 Tax=Winogradskyella sp. TaxID=1883156 RepID=UPI0017F6C778|nr:M12 family metallo-peptidase [Winogradskyella sp.]MBT8245217.1 T9SS type A sorting domain-containing protein [Winogradskyella sp.]NNK23369.1 T9SS type A sorting domain-containing protein [Winogradskyella sp.]